MLYIIFELTWVTLPNCNGSGNRKEMVKKDGNEVTGPDRSINNNGQGCFFILEFYPGILATYRRECKILVV